MAKVAVIYYSATGTNHTVAQAIAEAASGAGAEVRARLVTETAPEAAIDSNPQWREFVDSTQQSIDEMQRRMDDRLRDAFDQLTHIPEIKTDTQRLEARVGELEKTILRLEHSLLLMQPHRDVTSSDPLRDVPNTDTHFR